ncbi:MAG: efflux RND transporter permease subunit [Planctomycetes bacterium]|nr:efflux RND transporter permease subunit [Planctomycetota bacterium]
MSLPRFGVERPVPINLLMVGTILGGLVASFTLTKEFFPEMTPESVRITLPYPGATPEEVEEGLARKVEDALADLDEIDRITTTLSEGGGGIFAEFHSSVRDVGKAVDEVERAIDALTDLPQEAEEIRVAEFEPRLPVIMVSLFGDAPEEALKQAVRGVRDDLRTLPGMGEILFSGVRDYEIRVDVSAGALLEHRLSLPMISAAIRGWMADVPGGSVRTGVGDIRVRTTGVPERAEAIRRIVIKATADGSALTVADIAEVREYFVDEQLITRFGHIDPDNPDAPMESKPAMSLTVFKTGSQDAVEIAEMVRAYVQGCRGEQFDAYAVDRLYATVNALTRGEQRGGRVLRTPRHRAWELGRSAPPLPAEISTHSDLARFIEGRLDLLLRNAKWGALLVFATLMIFLNWRVACWVGVGLVVSICGALVIMAIVGITLNLLTMFGLIVVVGLLVDDAIVVAENIQARYDRKEPALTAAILGTEQVFWPVVATVLTSIVAFVPLRFIEGQIGDLIGALPVVVGCALIFSLVESLIILPSHMGHSLLSRDRARTGGFTSILRRYEQWRDEVILDRVVPAYARLLTRLMKYRYATIAVCLAVFVGSVGMVAGERLEFTFLPTSDTETIIIDLRMPIGTSIDRTDEVVRAIEAAAAAQPEVQAAGTVIGYMADLDTGTTAGLGGHLAQLYIELKPVELRERESSEVIDAIRGHIGVINDIERLTFSEIQGGPAGADITIIVSSEDDRLTEQAVARIRLMLAEYDGVRDIGDNSSLGQREVHVQLRSAAAGLDLTVADVATQVRGALFGLEPHVFSDRQEDIKVRVRLDEASRTSLYGIENMYVTTPRGHRVPLSEIADVTEGTAYSMINRINRRRATTVSADTAPWANPERITRELVPQLDELKREMPGISIELGGRQRTMAQAFGSLPLGFLAASVMIYIILAWLFGSYTQPLAIMLAIPFAITGMIWGHLLLGYQLTFLSLIGFVALSGIVVNDSLILVEFFNGMRRQGKRLREALVLAGRARLRPIFLTTITTILGLTPLMLEKSFQAKFLIPMAISISFGLMSATILILIALPCILVIFDDFKAVAYYLWHGRTRPVEAVHPFQDAHRE